MSTANHSRNWGFAVEWSHTFEDRWHRISNQSAVVIVAKHAAVKMSAADATILVQVASRQMFEIRATTVTQPLLTSVHSNGRESSLTNTSYVLRLLVYNKLLIAPLKLIQSSAPFENIIGDTDIYVMTG